MVESLKRNRWLGWLKRSFLVRLAHESAGDWRFPFMLIDWKFAAFLTRRRKVFCNGVEFTLPCNNWITHFRWFLFNTS